MSKQEQWQPDSNTLQWIIVIIFILVFAGAYQLIIRAEVNDPIAAIELIANKTDEAIIWQPSDERTAYLQLVKEVNSKKILSRRDIILLEKAWNKAEAVEQRRLEAVQKAQLTKKADAAL